MQCFILIFIKIFLPPQITRDLTCLTLYNIFGWTIPLSRFSIYLRRTGKLFNKPVWDWNQLSKKIWEKQTNKETNTLKNLNLKNLNLLIQYVTCLYIWNIYIFIYNTCILLKFGELSQFTGKLQWELRKSYFCLLLLEVRVLAVGPNASEETIPSISTEKAHMKINLFEIAKSSPSGVCEKN